MKAMPAVVRGARFFVDGENVMFEFVMDSRSRTAPRLATREDADKYPQAWARAGELPEINPPPVTFVEPEGGRPTPPPKPYAERRAAART